MFKRDEKKASTKALQEWLDTINRQILGLRWDDYEMKRSWEADRKRVTKILESRAAANAV
jgi:hypothetical protein